MYSKSPLQPIDPVIQQPGQRSYQYLQSNFYQAGQDSFTKPFSQNQELFQALTNVMPVAQGTFRLRHGYQLLNNTGIGAIKRLYSYQNIASSLRKLMYVSGTAVDVSNEDGSSVSNILTSATSNPRSAVSRDYAFFSQTQTANLTATSNPHGDGQKWHSTQGVTNWGIANGPTAPVSTGPNTGASAVDGGEGQSVWVNTLGIETNSLVHGGLGVNSFTGTNFSFSIPATAVIQGILIEVKGFATASGSGPAPLSIRLFKSGGGPVGNIKTINFSGVDSVLSFGGPSDLWGFSWAASDINAAGFGMFIPSTVVAGGSGTDNYTIDYIKLTIYYLGGVTIASTGGAGNITLTQGRTYLAAYRNSSSGHWSGLSLASPSTGQLINKNVVINVPYHGDSQVDLIAILATLDGNDQTTLYVEGYITNIPGSAGTTVTYSDNLPDTSLVVQNIALVTDDGGVIHGAANNNPPPVGMSFPTKHRGRLYGSIGETIVFSKNLDEVTTSTALVAGRWEEAWPAVNSIDVSTQKETIRGLLSDGNTLYIGTERHIWRLDGDGPLNFSKPEIIFNEAGIVNQDVWQVCFAEGEPVGMCWLTPDTRVVMSNFASYKDIGTPIQDVLSSINTSATNGPWGQFFSRQEFDVYVLAIPTGANNSPDTLCVYDLRGGRWCIWKPTDLLTAGLFNINLSGTPQWILAASTGKNYQMLPSNTQDRVNDTPVAITATITTPWMHFGKPTYRKTWNELEVITADPNMLVTITGASLNSQSNSPNTVVSNAALVASQFGYFKVYLAGSTARDKHYQITFTSNSGVQDILLGYTAELVPFKGF